ncbi:MAG: hypothetical protein ACRECH_10585, partial [Nitrososphaerales archaeon]
QNPSKKTSVDQYHFFTIARFGPDAIAVFILLGLGAIFLDAYGFRYISIVTAATLAIIFFVESIEIIHLSSPQRRLLVGAKCLVVTRASKTERGVVRVYAYPDGKLDSELWSAESGSLIEEGKFATVIGIRSIILQIEQTDAR